MQNNLNVPYFEQTRYSTCGPAALMMAMKYFDDSIEFSRGMEFNIWMKSNPIIFFGGTLQFGLARTAMKMGFKVEIFQKAKLNEYKSSVAKISNALDKLFSINSVFTKLSIVYKKDIFDVIKESLNRGIPPIVFVNLNPIIGENVLHWFVVTGIDDENVYVNDPYVPLSSTIKAKKSHPVDIKTFKEALSTDKVGNVHLPPCAILVYK